MSLELAELYNTVFDREDDVARLALETTRGCVISSIVVSHDTLVEMIEAANGHGWLEWTDAVRYRDGSSVGGWQAPANTAPDEADPAKVKILNGEICDDTTNSSLRVRHISGDEWFVETISEVPADCISYENLTLGVVRLDNNGTYQTLRHRTYWDTAAGRPIASRFIGFGEATLKAEGIE